MHFRYQRFTEHKPEEGVYGDCFRTALACLLNAEPEDVPHFLEGNPPDDQFWHAVHLWLRAQGFGLYSVAYEGASLDEVLASQALSNPGVYYLLAGESPRHHAHQVIACDDKIIHDPNPLGGGLIGPCPNDGLYWVNVLVPDLHLAPRE